MPGVASAVASTASVAAASPFSSPSTFDGAVIVDLFALNVAGTMLLETPSDLARNVTPLPVTV